MIRFRKGYILGTLFFAAVLVFYAIYQKEDQQSQVVFINVGQGDGIFVGLPGDVQILMDSGPGHGFAAKISNYMPFYDKDIELIILTHPHADHISGFIQVLKNYNVKNVILSGANYKSRIYQQFLDLISQEGGNIYLAKTGDTIKYQNISILKILAPLEIELGKSFKHIHEAMVVSQLNLGQKKFLLAGDMEEPLEQKLIASNAIQDIDVLKVGHHGSKTSTSEALLKVAKPEEAVIQVGHNSYGHPTPLVLNRLASFGVKVFRNDQLGDVVYK